MLEMLKFDTSCVFSSFDRTRCKIYDILCNVIFHVARINEHEQIHEYFHRDRNIFFNFYLNQRTKASMRLYERRTERDWFHPLEEISRREKKKLLLYIFRTNFRSNQEFSGLDEFLSKSNVQIFYITNFVWNDAIRGNDA